MKRLFTLLHESQLWLVILSFTVTSCLGSSIDQNLQGSSAAPSTSVFVQNSQVVYTTIEELVHYADIIIIGQPGARAAIINGARDINDPARPDPNMYNIAQIYEVKVISYVQGDGTDSLYVGQYEGTVLPYPQELTPSIIEQAREQAWQRGEFISLSLDERYIFFLMGPHWGTDFSEGHYSMIGTPWKFRIGDADCVYPESEYRLSDLWPPQTLESFLGDIANPPPAPESSPYPAPVVHGTPCQPALPATPYP